MIRFFQVENFVCLDFISHEIFHSFMKNSPDERKSENDFERPIVSNLEVENAIRRKLEDPEAKVVLKIIIEFNCG